MGVVRLISPEHEISPLTILLSQGYPEDLVVSVALGADMFDCVWPTRTAVRFRLPVSLHYLFAILSTNTKTEIRCCHHPLRRPQPPQQSIRIRFYPNPGRLQMHLLSTKIRGRIRYHKSICSPSSREGNCWSSSVRSSLLTSTSSILESNQRWVLASRCIMCNINYRLWVQSDRLF